MTNLDRYHRQMLLHGIDEAGQRRLLESHALVVGCGALGCVISETLTRAGVGRLTIVDRDIVELTNLQRQVLYTEADAREGAPKAIAAKARLESINSEIAIHAHIADFNHANCQRFVEGCDIIIDGLDNFETRYLLNDLAVRDGVPYIYGGAVGTTGMSMTVVPKPLDHATGCLRCVFPEAPPPGSSPTCDTAGVLGPAVNIIASWQATQAIKILSGNREAADRRMLSIDLWPNMIQQFDLASEPREDCPCCGNREFIYINGSGTSAASSLCGRDAVQVAPRNGSNVDLATIARQLSPHGTFTSNAHLLRGVFARESGDGGREIELTLFTDGRAIIKGTTDPDTARSIYAKYIGS